MRFERVVVSVVLASTLAVYTGCGSAPVKEQSLLSVSAVQVEQLSNYADVLTMYENAALALQGQDAVIYASDFTTLKKLGAKLAELKLESLKAEFEAVRLSTGQIPQNVIKTAQADAQNPPIPTAQWQAINDFIGSEASRTASAVKALIDQLEVGELNDQSRLVAMDDLHRITGDETWLVRRNEFVDRLIEDIREAKLGGILNSELQTKIDLVLDVRPNDNVLKQELISVSAEIYRTDYFKALGDGLADVAFKVFVKMSGSKNFDLIKEKLTPVSQNMVDYFIAEADESVKDPGNIAQSYRWYNQARVVSKSLGFKKKARPGHDTLVEQLHDKFKEYTESENDTLAYAYLHYMKEFRPLFKGLRQKLSETEEKVRSVAIKRLSTTAFEGAQGYGDVISSKITQHLFKYVANDIRIVEREKFDEIQRERSISGNNADLSAVDLIVTGSILEAKVDQTDQEGKKTIRAVVGKEVIPNTAYIKWLELSAKDRKSIEKPEETRTVDKQENIPIKVTNHRKLGIFSVSYRLLDASNGRVLFPDSITKEEQHKGVSREGVEMGDFNLPFELADLPSDIKILDNLANQVALDIGNSLVERLKDQEKRYLAEADEFEKDDSCSQQADRLAKALVILKAKSLETKVVFDKYKDVTINCDGS